MKINEIKTTSSVELQTKLRKLNELQLVMQTKDNVIIEMKLNESKMKAKIEEIKIQFIDCEMLTLLNIRNFLNK